ncbi:ketopantoate reductase family protein [Saccharopolyspora phatthalungensis]|uniref:2-dehydropantoate 2-reductase n=1 Tax=Saccharopolyspora phatthalungensis TaxID=664693 RepID=A0A840QIG4_9PSEU|nr:2-dehydropantoate 2-reductase N-terminal domain-containing protein [Saccharopolyspora phatthalungensis]MBB5157183.1 2-dehydropantoate 2-reductase [Saccharopolyspora phatthalungensis]
MSIKKIAVLGTGANGAGIGADLARAGVDVTFIEQWPENVEAIRADGVHVKTPYDATTTSVRALHLCEVATLREQFDLVFLLVKAYDTRWACELIKPYVKSDGMVVGLQNGMTVDDVLDVFGPARTLGAVIEVCAAMYVPGLVERHTPASESWFALGGVTPEAHERAPEVAEILRHAGAVEVVDDIRSAKWMKLAVNAGELVPSAIVNLPLLQAAKLPGMHDFMIRAGKEAIRAAIGLGHQVVPIFGIDAIDPEDPEGFVDVMLDAVYRKWSGPETRTTVLQDWLKNRHCEVNEVNGLVVSANKTLGGTCPVNSRTVEIAHQIERGELEAGPENAVLLVGT